MGMHTDEWLKLDEDFKKIEAAMPELIREKEKIMGRVAIRYSRTLEALASGEAIDEQEFFANSL